MTEARKKEFIAKSQKIHIRRGNVFDYSAVVYVNNATPVTITCQNEHTFQQLPANHSKGVGCAECSGKKPYTRDSFITTANRIHGEGKFDYSDCIFVNIKTILIIKCLACNNNFSLTPDHHINHEQGCPKCAGNQKLTTEEFIERAKSIEGNADKYDYSKVIYTSADDKVIIICKMHGEFEQRACAHLNKNAGCRFCAGNAVKTTDQFISEAIIVHGTKYDYGCTEYINAITKVKIKCLKDAHGEFEQMPNSHLVGSGCPKCKFSLGEQTIINFLKKLNIPCEPQKKFEGCKDVHCLPFDVYVEDFNLLIEYQGIQHYVPNSFMGGEEAFIKRQLHDNMKKQFCIDNGYKLLEIKYDEDVETKLIEYFKSINCWKDLIENSEFYNE